MHKISDIFYENIYHIFLEYCDKNNMQYMSELDNFDFDALKDVKGIGVSKIESIKNKYKDFKGSLDGIDIFSVIHKDNYLLSVETLSFFNISKNAINQLLLNNISTIEQLKDSGNYKLYSINVNLYLKVCKAVINYKEPLVKRLNEFLGALKKEEHFDVVLQRSKGITLNKIGESFKVTRERVRQIESGFLKRIKSILDIALIDIIKNYNYKSCINLNKLDFYFKDYEDLNLMKYTLSVVYKDKYLDFCNKLIINNDTKEKVLDRLLGITDYYIKDIVNFNKKMVVITESLNKNHIPYIDIEDLTNYLLLNGYIKKGNYIYKSGISYGQLCALVIRNNFKEGIRIHLDEDIDRLRTLVKEEFGDVSLPDNNRALGARICAYLVLWDRGCYTVTSNIKIPDSLLFKIRDYIDKSDETTIFFADLFAQFKDELVKKSSIKNRYFLQGVLKYFYEDEFIFERDSITKLGKERKNMRELISEFVKEKKRPVHKREIKEKFPGATEVVITNCQIANRDILQWEYNYFIHTDSLNIRNDDKKAILKTLTLLFNEYKGYISEQLLYDMLLKNNREFLYKNHIKNASNLFYLTSYLFGDMYLFRRPHILKDNTKKRELSSRVIVEKFLFNNGILKYTDYQNFVTMVKWSIGTAYSVFKDIEREIVRISEDEYIEKDRFNIDKKNTDLIFNIIREELKKRDFISLVKFDLYDLLPKIDFSWNPFVLSSVMEKYLPPDLKLVAPMVEDRRYVKEIIIKKDKNINSYEELIIDVILKNNLSGSTLYHLESVLSSLGLIGRYLPKELFNSKNIYIENDRIYT